MTSENFEAFVEAQLGDNELAAVELDLNWRLSFLLGVTNGLLKRAIAGERVDPADWPFVRDALDDSIAQLEALRKVFDHG